MEKSHANELVGELGRQLGLAALALDDSGRCALAIEDGAIIVHLRFAPAIRAIDITVPLDDVALSPPRLDALLAANFGWHGTEGASFALSPSSDGLVLQRRCSDGELAHGSLLAAVERLVKHARGWPRQLAAIEEGGSAAPHASLPKTGGLRG